MKIIDLVKWVYANREWILDQKDQVIRVLQFVKMAMGGDSQTIDMIIQAIEFVSSFFSTDRQVFGLTAAEDQYPELAVACAAEGLTLEELHELIQQENV